MRHANATVIGVLAGAVLVAASVSISAPSRAAEPMFPNAEIVELKNGVNSVDLDGDGTLDMVIRARNHSLGAGRHRDTLIFFVKVDTGEGWEWNLIEFDKPSSRGFTGHFSAYGDDECMSRDLRLLISGDDQRGRLTLILAIRELGRHVYDDDRVRFFLYELVDTNIPKILDFQRYEFFLKQVITTERKFCDVGKAFREELGIGQAEDR